MQLTNIQNLGPRLQPSAEKPNFPDPSPEPPKESFLQAGNREAWRNAVRWGNASASVSSGAGAITLASAGLYTGVLGGAIVGSALGLGVGPVLASLTSHGALNFVGTTLNTAGLTAKAGILLGGSALAVGGWGLGSTIGNAIGKPAGAIVGAPVGFANGAWGHLVGAPIAPDAPAQAKPEVRPVDLNQMKGATKILAMGLGGTGMLAGGTGGAVLGASLAGSHSLLTGLLAHNVSLAAITSGLGPAAAIGAAAGAMAGGTGGFEIAKAIQKSGLWLQGLESPAANSLKKLGIPAVGLGLVDVGAATSYVFQPSLAVGLGMAAVHILAGVQSTKEPDSAPSYFQTKSFGHTLLAAGHAAAWSIGPWSLVPISAGLVINTLADLKA